MMEKYEEMLDKLFENLPKDSQTSERFNIPGVLSHIQGNKTVISNFNKIVEYLNRKPEHLFKYLARALATPGDFKKNALILGSKIPSSRIDQKIKQYSSEFVLCRVCSRPDTIIMKENKLEQLKCNACGSQSTIRARI